MTIKKIFTFTIVLVITAITVGCDKSKTVSIIQNDLWIFEEKVDKISGKKTYLASTTLIDSSQPTKTVETEITCEDKNFFIRLTLYTKNDPTDSQSSIDVTEYKELRYATFRMRSGDNKFLKIAMSPTFSNQAVLLLKDTPEYLRNYAWVNDNKGGSEKSVVEELHGNELFIEIPSKYGSPIVTVNLDSPNVKKIFYTCDLVPPYMKKIEPPKEAIVTPPLESNTKTSTSNPIPQSNPLSTSNN